MASGQSTDVQDLRARLIETRIRFVKAELKAGFTFVELANVANNLRTPETRQEALAIAQTAQAMATRYLSLVSDELSEREKDSLTSQAQKLELLISRAL